MSRFRTNQLRAKNIDQRRPDQVKKSTRLEIFQITVGLFVSIATAFIGYKTYQLNENSGKNNQQLKEIEQRIEEDRFGFQRVRDVYDRIENYLGSKDQNESRGRALVVLVSILPVENEKERSIRSSLLKLVTVETTEESVRVAASESFFKESPEANKVVGNGEFFGKPELKAGPDGSYTVLTEFGYKDSKGIVWKVPPGTILSGNSIPRSVWSVLGAPFTGKQLRSLAIHEHYVATRERPVSELNSMLYESLINAGVSEQKSKIYYAAVSSFGPRWSIDSGS